MKMVYKCVRDVLKGDDVDEIRLRLTPPTAPLQPRLYLNMDQS